MSKAAATSLVTEGTELLLGDHFAEAILRFEKATRLCPPHAPAWRGLGHALLRLGRAHDAARALDHAIGLAPASATSLWAGAVAHAELGNRVVAQAYLARTLALQPSWRAMALGIPRLAALLGAAARASEALTAAFGPLSTRAFHHATEDGARIEVALIVDRPVFGQATFATLGLAEHAWDDPARPRIELLLVSAVPPLADRAGAGRAPCVIPADAAAAILANLALHLRATGYYPAPGTMVRDVVGALGIAELSARLPHIYVTSPRAWPGLPRPLVEGPPAITLAQVIPVSADAYARWVADPDALERALAAGAAG